MRGIQVGIPEEGVLRMIPREGYTIDSHGAIRRSEPKLSKAERRALRRKMAEILAENTEKAPLEA